MKFEVVAVNLEEGSPGEIAYGNTMRALQALEEDGQLDRMKLGGTVMVKPNFTQPPNPSLKFGPAGKRPDGAQSRLHGPVRHQGRL